ncbi:MAG: hypothetical protein AMS24_02340 [Chlamydiae bacterium SM23_39]|nr:MAG: hypothetical protein AMS24_02340 [Chlamydiae bacterium SM23_39]
MCKKIEGQSSFLKNLNFLKNKNNITAITLNIIGGSAGTFFLITAAITGVMVFKYPKNVVYILGKVGSQITSNNFWKIVSLSPFLASSIFIFAGLGVTNTIYFTLPSKNENSDILQKNLLKFSNETDDNKKLVNNTFILSSNIFILLRNILSRKNPSIKNTTNFTKKAQILLNHHHYYDNYGGYWIQYKIIYGKKPQNLWKLFLNPREEFFFVTLDRALNVIKEKTKNEFGGKIISNNTTTRKSKTPVVKDPCEPKMVFYFYNKKIFTDVVISLTEEFWDADIIGHKQGKRLIYEEMKSQWGPSFTKKINKLLFFTNGGFAESGRNYCIIGNKKTDKRQSIKNLRKSFYGSDEGGEEIFYLHKENKDPFEENKIKLEPPLTIKEKIELYKEKFTKDRSLTTKDLLNLQRIIYYANENNLEDIIETTYNLMGQAIFAMSTEEANDLEEYLKNYEKLQLEDTSILGKAIKKNKKILISFEKTENTIEQLIIGSASLNTENYIKNITNEITGLIQKIKKTKNLKEIIDIIPPPIKDLFEYMITYKMHDQICDDLTQFTINQEKINKDKAAEIKAQLLPNIKLIIDTEQKHVKFKIFIYNCFFNISTFVDDFLENFIRSFYYNHSKTLKEISNTLESINTFEVWEEKDKESSRECETSKCETNRENMINLLKEQLKQTLKKYGYKFKNISKFSEDNYIECLIKRYDQKTFNKSIEDAKKTVIELLKSVITEIKKSPSLSNIVLYHSTQSKNIIPITTTQINVTKNSLSSVNQFNKLVMFALYPLLRYGDLAFRVLLSSNEIKHGSHLCTSQYALNKIKLDEYKNFDPEGMSVINSSDIWLSSKNPCLINIDTTFIKLHKHFQKFKTEMVSLIKQMFNSNDLDNEKHLIIKNIKAIDMDIKLTNGKIEIYFNDQKATSNDDLIRIFKKDCLNNVENKKAKNLFEKCLNNKKMKDLIPKEELYHDYDKIPFFMNPKIYLVASENLERRKNFYYEEYYRNYKFHKKILPLKDFITYDKLKKISENNFNSSLQILPRTVAILIDHFVRKEIGGVFIPKYWATKKN